jgi:hypothetical protein
MHHSIKAPGPIDATRRAIFLALRGVRAERYRDWRQAGHAVAMEARDADRDRDCGRHRRRSVPVRVACRALVDLDWRTLPGRPVRFYLLSETVAAWKSNLGVAGVKTLHGHVVQVLHDKYGPQICGPSRLSRE